MAQPTPQSNMKHFEANGISTSYIDDGPRDGPLLIFIHGWPGIADTWKHQQPALVALGFRVVAPDMRGYGFSTATREVRDYRLERLVADQLALLAHLERDNAVWIGHDWGSGVVWALAAHHPEVCTGVVNLCVPYRTIELGYKAILPLVNRAIYPAAEYPLGQWSYMAYYEQYPSQATEQFDAASTKALKLFYARADVANYNKPSRTSRVLEEGGWFGGMKNLPDIPLAKSVLDEQLYTDLQASQARNSYFGATAYYLNHDVNEPYSRAGVKNGAVLDMPVLFIGAKYDATCATANSRLAEPMRRYCRDLTECTVDGAHWVQLECPTEVNSALVKWLATALPSQWPFNYSIPLTKS